MSSGTAAGKRKKKTGSERKALDRVSPELQKLDSRIGEFIEYWGFKKIHGRIWTHLFLAAEPLSATELCRRLKVSKTLLSFSVADLLAYRVIEEAGKGPRRTVFYRANPELTEVIAGVLRARESLLMQEIRDAHQELAEASDPVLSAEKVAELGRWIESAQGILELLLQLSGSRELPSQFVAMSRVMQLDSTN